MRCHWFGAMLLAVSAAASAADGPPSDSPKGGRTLGDLLGQPENDADAPERIRVEPAKPDKPGPPPKKAIEEATALIHDLYKKEMAAAKTPAERSTLARVLLKQANESRSDPAGYFVLLDEACSFAAKGGDTITAFQALDRLTDAFDVPLLDRKLKALEALSGSSPPPAHKQIAEMALALVDQAVEVDDYKMAKDLVTLGAASARKSKDAAAGKLAVARTADIDRLSKQYSTIKDAIVTVEKSPDDPKANLTAGTYYCFTKGNWARGLPMLAKGDNADFKALSDKDLAKPRESVDQLAIGDGWWDLAEAQEDPSNKVHLRVRACEWYRQALPNVTGLAKAKAEKRVADVSEELAKGPSGSPTLPLFARAQDAVKNGRLNLVHPKGFGIGQKWSDVPEQGGVLVGLDVGLNPRDGTVVAVRGIYATQRGEIEGKLFGMATPLAVKLRSKAGYAVSGFAIRGGLNVDGLVVTFMQIQGDRLNSTQSYRSDNIGGRVGDNEELAVTGEPIIGLHGHLHRDGRIASLGTITPSVDSVK